MRKLSLHVELRGQQHVELHGVVEELESEKIVEVRVRSSSKHLVSFSFYPGTRPLYTGLPAALATAGCFRNSGVTLALLVFGNLVANIR